MKRKVQRQQGDPANSIRFARNLFWFSWIWVLLFVVGDLLQAETQGYGAKIVFGLVTLLAIGSGGFALEKTLISARAAKTHRPRTARPSTSNRRSGKTETMVEESIEEALPTDTTAKADDGTGGDAAAQKPRARRKRTKAPT